MQWSWSVATNTICILNNTEYVIDTAPRKVSEKSIYTKVDTLRTILKFLKMSTDRNYFL